LFYLYFVGKKVQME